MEAVRVDFGGVEARLDYRNWSGVILRQPPSQDVFLDGAYSLQAAGWDACMRHLWVEGFEPVVDEWGLPEVLGTLVDGTEVIPVGRAELD